MNVRRHFIAMKLFRRLISEAVLAMTAYWISPPFKRTNNVTLGYIAEINECG